MTSTLSPATVATPKAPALRILLATLYAAVVAAIANTIITLAGIAAGANTTYAMGLHPQLYVPFTIVGVLLGAIGWFLIARFSKHAPTVLKIVVPIVFLITLVPLVGFGLLANNAAMWTAMITLAIVHLVTVMIGVLVYQRVIPLGR